MTRDEHSDARDEETSEKSVEAVDRLDALLDAEVLDPDLLDDAAVTAELAKAGFDPDAVARRGATAARRAARGEPDWQAEARRKIARRRERMARQPRRPPSPTPLADRDSLIQKLKELRDLPDAEERVAAYFRAKQDGEISDAELAGFIEDLELLRQMLQEE